MVIVNSWEIAEKKSRKSFKIFFFEINSSMLFSEKSFKLLKDRDDTKFFLWKTGTHYTHLQNIFISHTPRYGSFLSFFMGCCTITRFLHKIPTWNKRENKDKNVHKIIKLLLYIYQPEQETVNFRNFTKK